MSDKKVITFEVIDGTRELQAMDVMSQVLMWLETEGERRRALWWLDEWHEHELSHRDEHDDRD
jgi:hypothetical protein